jgi:hypothetical protein
MAVVQISMVVAQHSCRRMTSSTSTVVLRLERQDAEGLVVIIIVNGTNQQQKRVVLCLMMMEEEDPGRLRIIHSTIIRRDYGAVR